MTPKNDDLAHLIKLTFTELEVLQRVLLEKGIVTIDDLRTMFEKIKESLLFIDHH